MFTIPSMQSLNRKVKRGLGWVFWERLFLRGLVLVRLPILASLLDPRDFGLMSIITTVFSFVNVITRTGFDAALIQKADEVDSYLDVGWSLSFVKGVAQTLILLLLIQPMVLFYEEPLLAPLFLLMTLSVFFSNLNSIRIVVLTRELEIRRITLYNIITDVLATVVTVGFACWLHNVWALVWGNLANSIFKLVGSFVVAPYRPKFDFDRIKMKEIWSFGKWVLVSGIFLTSFRHADDLFVGKVLGITALGYYATAYKLGNLVTTELVDAVRKILFPAFSILQHDLSRLRKSFLVSYQMTTALGALFSLGLSLLAPEFVLLILGEKWSPVIPALRVLAIWGGFQMLSTTMAPLFRAVGRPDWWAKVQIFKVALLAITIYPFSIYWDITGTSFSVLFASMLEIPVGLSFAQRALQCEWRDILRPLWIPCVSIMIVVVFYMLTHSALALPPLWHLLVFGSFIVILYGLVLTIMDIKTKAGYWTNLKKL